MSALAYKLKDNNITIIESFNFDKPNTKEFNVLIGALNMSDTLKKFFAFLNMKI